MYPFVRAGLEILRARRVPGRGVVAATVTRHRAWPWDVDMYGELNNGRILTLMELGRWRLAVETGLLAVMRRRRAAFAAAGVSVRYRRRITLMQRYRIDTRVLGWDARFIYIEQTMWQDGTACHNMLLRAAIIGRTGTLAPAEIAAEMGHEGPSPQLPGWVRNWIDAEATRPWPPEPVDLRLR